MKKNKNIIKLIVIGSIISFSGSFFTYKNPFKVAEVKAETISIEPRVIKDKKKVWKINFNRKVLESTVNGKNVYITNSNGENIDTTLALSKDKKTILVSVNKNGYNSNESYTLFVENIKDNSGVTLENYVKMPFQLECFTLGDENLFTSNFSHLIDGKNIGLVTNQTAINSSKKWIVDSFANYKKANLVALYAPEHGIDGKAKAGEAVKDLTYKPLNIPIYSLYGNFPNGQSRRKPTSDMLKNIDVLVFDIQDLGSRTYTFMSTMNYCIAAAKENNKPIIILDRPNPLGANKVYGNIVEDNFITFLGVDNLPMIHGMTAGELAKYFNRKIGADLTVVPMSGYTRDMVWQDTKLNWVQSSPFIPDIDSVFGYAATGLGEGTGLGQRDCFKGFLMKGLNSKEFARLLNSSGLEGVEFIPEDKGSYGGAKLKITDYKTFNPGKVGYYALAYAKILGGANFKVPISKEGTAITKRTAFEKVMGTDKISKNLMKNMSPKDIEKTFEKEFNDFLIQRNKYLIYK